MFKFRYALVVLGMLLCSVASAAVQMSIGIGLPNVSIGINVPVYPAFVVIPGYPVYYAPRMEANFFFYDGLYWVYQDDNWYQSSWYNGPWWFVYPEDVPLFILRVPVRYYRLPPAYFIGWQYDAPPRWGDHWGRDWNQHRSGWDRWDRRSAPAPAPLPSYQRQYSGDRYPRQVEQQHDLHQQNYRYQPRDPVVRKQYQEQLVPRAPAQQEKSQQDRQTAPEDRDFKPQDKQQSMPRQQDRQEPLRSQPPKEGGVNVQRAAPATQLQVRPEVQEPRQQPQQGAVRREQSTQGGGVEVQRATPTSPQRSRTEAQDRQQSSQPGLDQHAPQRSSEQGQKKMPQGQNATGEPRRRQEQEQDRGRNE